MEEGFKEVPGDDGVEVYFVDFMGENRVIVFPGLLNTKQKIFDGVSVFESVKPGAVDQFVVKGLS